MSTITQLTDEELDVVTGGGINVALVETSQDNVNLLAGHQGILQANVEVFSIHQFAL